MTIETICTTKVTFANGEEKSLTNKKLYSAGDNPRYHMSEISNAIYSTERQHLKEWDAVLNPPTDD